MKKLLALILTLCTLLTGTALADDGADKVSGLTHDIVILFTSDVHCGIDQNFGYVGLHEVRRQFEKKGNHVLLVDNGDAIQGEPVGSLTKGEAIINIMNAMRYDIAIPGNHEFDYGVERFLELTKQANFPYISSNFNYKGELVFEPYVIKEFEGVKIAFVGVTTPKTYASTSIKNFQDDDGNLVYNFMESEDGEKLYAAVQSAVDSARAEGADYVIALCHLGNEAEVRPYTYADLIEHTSGIDAVLDGHSHDTIRAVVKNKDGEDVIRQACGTKLEGIGTLTISAADGSVNTGLYLWNNDVSAPELLGLNNYMTEVLQEATITIDSRLRRVVAKSSYPLIAYDPEAVDESGKPIRIIRRAETNLGDLYTDAERILNDADVAIISGGGLQKDIPAGDITYNDILTLLPYGNKIVTIEVTGQQLLDALEWGSRLVPSENGAFLQVSGLSYEIHTYIESSCQEDEFGMFAGVTGEYRVKNVMVAEEPLQLDGTYTLTNCDYMLLNNGDGFTMFDSCTVLDESGVTDVDLLLEYIQDTLGGQISSEYADPYGQGRIVAVEEAQ